MSKQTGTTTLLQMVEAVSENTRDDLETVQVMGRLLARNSFVLAGDADREVIFRRRVASADRAH